MQDTGKETGPELSPSRRSERRSRSAGGSRRLWAGRHPCEAAGSEDGDLARSLMQYIHIALKRKWLILSVVLGVVALGLLKAVLATPRYTANVRIQIDREAMKVLDRGMTAPQEEGGTDFLKTQFELLKSRAMAERVVSTLRLKDDAEFLAGARTVLAWQDLGVLEWAGAQAYCAGSADRRRSV